MGIKRTLLTAKQFELIDTTVDWNIKEVPLNHWDKIPGLQRRDDTFAILASGTMTDPKLLNGIESIAGMDVLVHETNPKIEFNEPEGNAYHYVVQRINDDRYPYILNGPFKVETKIAHWFEATDLTTYWNDKT
ncbi:MAG: hypothetical protein O6943_00325 [Bacteroidetes bacterium]|nr:hypothetical protein [Bacteroidota bacterium]